MAWGREVPVQMAPRSQERRTNFPTEPEKGHGITRGSDGVARSNEVNLDAFPKNNVDVFFSVISNTLDL
jgi:ribonuclease PH